DEVVYTGTNGKMTEVSAAMGLTNLDNLDAIVATNRRNWLLYRDGLAGVAGVKLFHFNGREQSNDQYVVVEIDAGSAGLNRDELASVLWAENVIARKYFWPGCHRMEPY